MSCSDQYLSYSSQYPLNCSGSYPLMTELFRLIFTELFKSISELLRPVLSTKLFRLISDNPLSCSGWYLSYSGQYPLNCSGLYLLSCSGRYSQYIYHKDWGNSCRSYILGIDFNHNSSCWSMESLLILYYG